MQVVDPKVIEEYSKDQLFIGQYMVFGTKEKNFDRFYNQFKDKKVVEQKLFEIQEPASANSGDCNTSGKFGGSSSTGDSNSKQKEEEKEKEPVFNTFGDPQMIQADSFQQQP